MNRRSFLATTAVAAAAGAAAPGGRAAAAGRTFVLVHGAWHGGWCWSRVAQILRGRGHRVFTPTMTGLGERSHLISRSIDLELGVTDVANVLKFEDLKDVVLVGHSFAGSAISGVADRMPERLRQLVYLDAIMLEDGESPFSRLPEDVVAARAKQAQESSAGLSVPAPSASAFGVSNPEQAAWVEAHLTPHPFSTFNAPMKLAHKIGNGVPASYIVCVDPIYKALESSRDWVKRHGWKMTEIASGHDAMVIAPDHLAEMLDAESA
jgi:pimeloyl-ACP methyl ester carboxylesterase